MTPEDPVLLHDFVAHWATHTPDSTAVRDGQLQWTYREFDEHAERFAHALRAKRVQPGDRVGVWLDKGAWALAAMQGILRVGAAYVPLDTGSPAARIKLIADNCEFAAVVCAADRRSAADDLGADCIEVEDVAALEPDHLPAVRGSEHDLAYILYTSGSTGAPKGVAISHLNAIAFIAWAADELGVSSDDVLANHAPFHFDISVLDLYVSWKVGAAVVLIPTAASFVPAKLVEYAQQVSVWYSVPSALILMMEAGDFSPATCPALRTICFAGEPFPLPRLRELRERFPSARLINLYGPTETNVCTWYETPESIDPDATSIPIGKACSGDRVWAEDASGRTVSSGEEGELFVEGPTVCLGYWGGEAHVGPYATGDLVRFEPDGNYTYIGRRDQMVKVQGHRIEMGEIEAAVLEHEAVDACAVVVAGEGLEAKIVAVLKVGGDKPSLLAMKAHCAQRLPKYMLPDRTVVVDELPLNRNGKIDRRAIASSLQTGALT